MNAKPVIWILLSFILWQSCQTDHKLPPEGQKEPVSAILDSFSLDILVLKKDAVMELWSTNQRTPMKRLCSFQLIDRPNWPLGIFKIDLSKKEQAQFIFPNSFYQEKALLDGPKIEQYDLRLDLALNETDRKQLNKYLTQAIDARVLICPNDIRAGNVFTPQLNGTIWLPELYTLLELHLNEYN